MGKSQQIVVTGASGFIAKHVMSKLLNAGYQVRGTVRDEKKADAIRQTLENICGGVPGDNLDLVVCDLLSDEGWGKAMEGASAVMHLATVVPDREPKDPDEVIRPALEGTERVLKYASMAGINRVVMTSSIAAIGYGHSSRAKTLNLTIEDWTDVAGLKGTWAYPEAKARAELRAWEMAEKNQIDLTCICPSMVFGPAVDEDTSASLEVVKRLMNGQVPALPPGGMSVVDVRDVAQIHVDALSNDDTIGKRIISSAEYITFQEVARILREAYPDQKFPNRTVPIWLMKILGRFDRTVKQIAADLETVRHYDGAPGAKLMDRDYRNGQEATLSAAESLIELGMVKVAN